MDVLMPRAQDAQERPDCRRRARASSGKSKLIDRFSVDFMNALADTAGVVVRQLLALSRAQTRLQRWDLCSFR